jgi:hypothetical protein
MSPEGLEAQASGLLAAAKLTTSPARRQMLVSMALELTKRATQLRAGEPEADAANEGPLFTEGYRLWLDGSSDESLWINLSSISKPAALWATDAVAAACADCYHTFELWEQMKLIYMGETKRSVFSLKPAAEVDLASQQIVLDIEKDLCASQLAVARSKKLLALTERLRQHLAKLQSGPAFFTLE